MWDECNSVVVWTFFGTAFLWDWKTGLFQSCGHCWVFQICSHIWEVGSWTLRSRAQRWDHRWKYKVRVFSIRCYCGHGNEQDPPRRMHKDERRMLVELNSQWHYNSTQMMLCSSVGYTYSFLLLYNITSSCTKFLQFSSVQSLSRVWLFVTPWIAARQASLSITSSRSSLKLTSIELVMPSSHLIVCLHLLLLPPIPPSIRVFPNESTLLIKWPKYWSFSLSIIPSNEHPGLISFRMDWLDLFAVQGTHFTCILKY